MKDRVNMVATKQTKGTTVFTADRDDAPITTLYVRKLSPLSKAEKIYVTIDDGKETA